MAKLKQDNQADKELIVGSLKVLHNTTGAGFDKIKREISSLSTSLATVSEKQENYWRNVSDDAIVTPAEKKELKKQWQEIQQTYAAIMQVARERHLDDAAEISALTDAYNSLYNYLFVTIRLFDNMTDNTELGNPATFNNYYNIYFNAQTLAQAVLAGTSAATIRILNDLTESGIEGEVAVYQRLMYKFSGGNWQQLSASGYLGIYNMETPEDANIGDYFLCGADFSCTGIFLTSDGTLLVDEENNISVSMEYTKGYVYVLEENGWQSIQNKNDYRYLIATNDLYSIGEEISSNLVNVIEAKSGGNYLGLKQTDPINPKENDYYTYNGPTTAQRKKGIIYKYQASTTGDMSWQPLESTDVNNYKCYMTALNDVLISQKDVLDPAYFSTIFTKSLIANTAFIKQLASQIIELQEGEDGSKGIIKSSNFATETKQLIIQYSNDGSYWVNYIPERKNVFFVKLRYENEELITVNNYGNQGYIVYAITDDINMPSEWNNITDPIIVPNGKYLWIKNGIYTTSHTYGPYYNGIKQGFKIDTDGNATFYSDVDIGGNAVIGEDAIIHGKISNEVMEIAFVPEEIKNIKTYDAGTRVLDIANYLDEKISSYATWYSVTSIIGSKFGKCTYGSLEVTRIKLTRERSGDFIYFNDDNTYINDVNVDTTIPDKLIFYVDLGNRLSVIFKNLPDIEPSQSGRLWVSNGTLKIKS